MAKPYIHAESSAKRFGGKSEDYVAIHEFLDSSKSYIPDVRHRALTHNSFFIEVIIPRIFGKTIQSIGIIMLRLVVILSLIFLCGCLPSSYTRDAMHMRQVYDDHGYQKEPYVIMFRKQVNGTKFMEVVTPGLIHYIYWIQSFKSLQELKDWSNKIQKDPDEYHHGCDKYNIEGDRL